MRVRCVQVPLGSFSSFCKSFQLSFETLQQQNKTNELQFELHWESVPSCFTFELSRGYSVSVSIRIHTI